MSASTLLPIEQLPVAPVAAERHSERVGFFRAWTSSFLVYFFPRKTGRVWVDISLRRAAVVAMINFALAPLWLMLLTASVEGLERMVIRNTLTGEFAPHPLQVFRKLFEGVPGEVYAFWTVPSQWMAMKHLAVIIGTSGTLITGFGILFFVLLPFGARPGRNRACVMHTLRALLLSTGWVHVWGPVLSATFVIFIVKQYMPGLENYVEPLLVVVMLLTLWTLGALIVAMGADYRRAKDFPEVHDPWCEACGYNLSAAAPEGRCPECGTAVADSIGPGVRPPTPWEQRPSIFNGKAISSQVSLLFRQPRTLFFSMPTLTGQDAAHRWLLGSVTAVGLLASLILPAGVAFQVFAIDWGWTLTVGSLAVGLVWAILALMMVGIETAGIATFSRLKARSNPDPSGPGGVYLATASKVTAYSSSLMWPWVILGGAQLIAFTYLQNVETHSLHPMSIRLEQIILACSLSAAHIGGLLWYELTVYRGIRAIQYANK
jgi:hypothetical protein